MNQTILITGSSRGIGRAIALKLAADGYNIVVHCNTGVDSGKAVVDEVKALGQEARLLQFDSANREQCKSILEADIEAHGAYFGVVTSAGITRDNAFPSIEADDWDQVISTNLDGFYNVLHPIVMPMIRTKQPGRIVTLASVSGIMGNRGQVNYSAAKAGVIGASKALALELAKRKITVNCVAPGLIQTDMINDLPIDEIKKMIPLRRLGQPEEVAATVSFLMSPGAAYITRQVISVNGGLC